MKRQGVPLEDLSRLMSKKFEVPCKRRGCEIVTRSTTAAEAIVKSKLWTCTLWKTTVKIKLLQNKNQWSLITMQNHNEKFYHICEKMKLQIHALLNWCWYDDICVIAEDDPVRTLRLAFDHIYGTYSYRQIIVHAMHDYVQNSIVPDNPNRLHICHGNWTSVPQSPVGWSATVVCCDMASLVWMLLEIWTTEHYKSDKVKSSSAFNAFFATFPIPNLYCFCWNFLDQTRKLATS